MMVGSILTAPVTIAITIVDPDNPQATQTAQGNKKGKKNKKKAPVEDEDNDIEQGSVAAESTANSYSLVGGNKSPNKKSANSRNKNDEVNVEMVDYEESKQGHRKANGSSGLFNSMTKKSTNKHNDREDL